MHITLTKGTVTPGQGARANCNQLGCFNQKAVMTSANCKRLKSNIEIINQSLKTFNTVSLTICVTSLELKKTSLTTGACRLSIKVQVPRLPINNQRDLRGQIMVRLWQGLAAAGSAVCTAF